jgi:hypothetical protein
MEDLTKRHVDFMGFQRICQDNTIHGSYGLLISNGVYDVGIFAVAQVQSNAQPHQLITPRGIQDDSANGPS